MGESVVEATVTKWLMEVGDKVVLDDVVLEIATDKVDTDVTSEVTGVLFEKRVQENEVVSVGDVLAVIEIEGETTIEQEDKVNMKQVNKKVEYFPTGEIKIEKDDNPLKYLLNRRVDDFVDINDDNVYYRVFTYLISLGDPDEGGGEERDELFEFIIKLENNSILDGYYEGKKTVYDYIECEFSDPYEEEFYELNELESLFSNDVSEFGDKLSSIIDIQKVKEAISKYKK